ncbi:MAG: hypothetical protein H7843_04840 [Nitrospirota bacterium]
MKAGIINITTQPEILYFSKTTKGCVFLHKEPLDISDGFTHFKIPGKADVFYVSLPVSALNCRIIETPFSDKKKIISTIPFALYGLTTGDVEKLVFDCILDSTGAIAVYVEREILTGVFNALRENGIGPEMVTAVISLELRYNYENRPIDRLLDSIDSGAIPDDKLTALCCEEFKSPLVDFASGLPRRTAEEIKKSLRPTAYLIAAIVVVLITYMAVKTHLINKRIDGINTQMSETYSRMFPGEKRQPDPLYALRTKLKRANDASALFASLSPLDILKTVTGQPGIIITGVDMNLSKTSIKGEATSDEQLNSLLERLRRSFPDVTVEEDKTGTNVLFSISIRANQIDNTTNGGLIH